MRDNCNICDEESPESCEKCKEELRESYKQDLIEKGIKAGLFVRLETPSLHKEETRPQE